MSLDELKEKHAGSVETASEAFHELCAMVEAIEVGFFTKLDIFQVEILPWNYVCQNLGRESKCI